MDMWKSFRAGYKFSFPLADGRQIFSISHNETEEKALMFPTKYFNCVAPQCCGMATQLHQALRGCAGSHLYQHQQASIADPHHMPPHSSFSGWFCPSAATSARAVRSTSPAHDQTETLTSTHVQGCPFPFLSNCFPPLAGQLCAGLPSTAI